MGRSDGQTLHGSAGKRVVDLPRASQQAAPYVPTHQQHDALVNRRHGAVLVLVLRLSQTKITDMLRIDLMLEKERYLIHIPGDYEAS